jgi:hypothetical protein
MQIHIETRHTTRDGQGQYRAPSSTSLCVCMVYVWCGLFTVRHCARPYLPHIRTMLHARCSCCTALNPTSLSCALMQAVLDAAAEAAAMQTQLSGLSLTHPATSPAASCAPPASVGLSIQSQCVAATQPCRASSCQQLIDSTIGTSGAVNLSTSGSGANASQLAGAAAVVPRPTAGHSWDPVDVWPHLVSIRIKGSMEVTEALLGGMAAALLSRLQVSVRNWGGIDCKKKFTKCCVLQHCFSHWGGSVTMVHKTSGPAATMCSFTNTAGGRTPARAAAAMSGHYNIPGSWCHHHAPAYLEPQWAVPQSV